jgi:hypothetical protein
MFDHKIIFCPITRKECMCEKCAWYVRPIDAITGTFGCDRCAIAMIAQQLNDISNTEMGAERL